METGRKVKTSPLPLRDEIRRPRLLPLGLEMLEYQVTAVVAPAGYGKSVWVSSLLEEPGWPDTVWITLDSRDAKLPYFFRHVFQAVIGETPLPEKIGALKDRGKLESNWPTVAEAFLHELAGREQLVLVLDQLQSLSGDAAFAFLDFLLERLPRAVRIVLISRGEPPLKLYQLEIRNQLMRIGRDALLFQADEAKALFEGMRLKLTEGDLEALLKITEGWAVGLRLIGIYMQKSGASPGDALMTLSLAPSNFDFFAVSELLAVLRQDLYEFLLQAAFLPRLEEALCNAAFDRADSAQMLTGLNDAGFICPLPEAPGSWRIHRLLKQWLDRIAAEQLTQERAEFIRLRAIAFYERRGEIGQAAEACLRAGDCSRAAKLLRHHGNDCYARGLPPEPLFDWIGALPGAEVERDCWLLFFRGTAQVSVNDHEALRILSQAADLAAKKGERKCEAASVFSMILSAFSAGVLEMIEAAGERLRRNPALMTDPASRGEALAAALQYCMATDNLKDGILLSRSALRQALPPEMHMWVRFAVGYLYSRVGLLEEARTLMEETLTLPYVRENDRRLAVGSEILLDILFLQADFPAFETVCGTCMALGRKYGMMGILGRVQYLGALRAFREGNQIEARRQLEHAYEAFSAAGIVHFANLSAVELQLLQMEDGEDTVQRFEEILELKSRFEQIPYGVGVDTMVNTLSAVAAMEAGRLNEAAAALEQSAEHWRELGTKLSLAGTNLLRAHVALLLGDEKGCDRLLGQALAAAEIGRWTHFWEWRPAAIRNMCRRAVHRNIHPQWALRILNRWFPAEALKECSLLLCSPDALLQASAAEFLQQQYQKTGKSVLSVFYLGGYRLFCNGCEVEEGQWKTIKATRLFQSVIADRRLRNKDNLMQALWPDGDDETNDGRLRMTLSYVRKALASAGMPPDSIQMQRGMIRLEPSVRTLCDYEIFTEAARQGLRFAENSHPYAVPALEAAAAVYTGEFLPEELYEEWTAVLRAALGRLYVEVLTELAKCRLSRNEAQLALEACEKILLLEPVYETALRLSMASLDRLNRKNKALEMYRNFKSVLEREYGALPEEETVKLYRAIQAGFQE